MPLTKAQIIEIQVAADYNHRKRLQEQKEKEELNALVAEKIEERTKAPVASTSDKKGK